jgi:hypothetical protein
VVVNASSHSCDLFATNAGSPTSKNCAGDGVDGCSIRRHVSQLLAYDYAGKPGPAISLYLGFLLFGFSRKVCLGKLGYVLEVCGRYRLTAMERWLSRYFNVDPEGLDWAARWNVAATQEVATIRQDRKEPKRTLAKRSKTTSPPLG